MSGYTMLKVSKEALIPLLHTHTHTTNICTYFILHLLFVCVCLQDAKDDSSAFICPLCEKNCMTQHGLTMHIRQVSKHRAPCGLPVVLARLSAPHTTTITFSLPQDRHCWTEIVFLLYFVFTTSLPPSLLSLVPPSLPPLPSSVYSTTLRTERPITPAVSVGRP